MSLLINPGLSRKWQCIKLRLLLHFNTVVPIKYYLQLILKDNISSQSNLTSTFDRSCRLLVLWCQFDAQQHSLVCRSSYVLAPWWRYNSEDLVRFEYVKRHQLWCLVVFHRAWKQNAFQKQQRICLDLQVLLCALSQLESGNTTSEVSLNKAQYRGARQNRYCLINQYIATSFDWIKKGCKWPCRNDLHWFWHIKPHKHKSTGKLLNIAPLKIVEAHRAPAAIQKGMY